MPYSIAKPFLDKKSYVVLSDLTTTQNSAEQGELLDDDKSDELDIGQIIVEIRSSYDSRSRLTFMVCYYVCMNCVFFNLSVVVGSLCARQAFVNSFCLCTM